MVSLELFGEFQFDGVVFFAAEANSTLHRLCHVLLRSAVVSSRSGFFSCLVSRCQYSTPLPDGMQCCMVIRVFLDLISL